MATAKTRINISVSKRMREDLRALAKRDQKPLAGKVVDLVEQALELEEDLFLSRIAEERLKNHRGRWVPFEEAWRMIEKKAAKKRTR
jgi:predicted DNA-binding protein